MENICNMESYEGKCSCGDIEFGFEGEPINSVFCYCKECQTHTGSDKWFGLWVPTDKFKITKGLASSYTRIADSGHEVHHNFCSNCGTTVCAEITVANFYSVPATALIKHNFSPTMAIYAASAPKWAVFPEGLPKYDILPPGMGG